MPEMHLAGTAYCDCEIGEAHDSNDPEADEAWDTGGPAALQRLYATRMVAEIKQLRAENARLRAVEQAATALLRECDECDELAPHDDEPMFSTSDIRRRFAVVDTVKEARDA